MISYYDTKGHLLSFTFICEFSHLFQTNTTYDVKDAPEAWRSLQAGAVFPYDPAMMYPYGAGSVPIFLADYFVLSPSEKAL